MTILAAISVLVNRHSKTKNVCAFFEGGVF